jgi:hypothetical protein
VRAAILGLPWPPPGVESADDGEDDDGEERESQSVMQMDFAEESLAG